MDKFEVDLVTNLDSYFVFLFQFFDGQRTIKVSRT